MRAILTYHSIDDSGSPISVTREAFRRHMQWLARSPIQVTTLTELLSQGDPADAVAITFDDAFANFETEAAPLLRELALPATVFVVSDRVGLDNSWCGKAVAGIPQLPLMTWNALERTAGGPIAVGAHSRTHRDLGAIEASALRDEIMGSADEIDSRLGTRPDAFAYPYGSFTGQAADLVSQHFLCGCTTELRPLEPMDAPALLPRLDMYYYQNAGRLEAWGTRTFDRYLALRRWGRRLRGAATGASRR